MITSLFAALLGKTFKKFFVNISHFKRLKLIGAHVKFLVLIKNGRKPIVLYHLADGATVIEMLDNIVNVF